MMSPIPRESYLNQEEINKNKSERDNHKKGERNLKEKSKSINLQHKK